MEEKFFTLKVSNHFIDYFNQYEKYLLEHDYNIDKSFRLQEKIFKIIDEYLLANILSLQEIEHSGIRKIIIEDHIIYYNIEYDEREFVLRYVKNVKQSRKICY